VAARPREERAGLGRAVDAFAIVAPGPLQAVRASGQAEDRAGGFGLAWWQLQDEDGDRDNGDGDDDAKTDQRG
jgi:hypothetical protein